LKYYQTERPVIYEIVDEYGRFICSFTNKEWLSKYQRDGYVIIELDLDSEIEIIKNRISSIESNINY
jgi:hypothetical protein